MNITLKLTPSRLLAGFGILTLLAGLSLIASRPARSVGGPVAVSVANVPLPTTPTDEAAPHQIFQTTTQYVINPGSSTGQLNSPANSDITVPAGKRLVIQAVSAFTVAPFSGTSPTGEITHAYIVPYGDGTYQSYALPSIVADGASLPGVTQSVTLYADPGFPIIFDVSRNVTTGTEYVDLTISGYLVNI